MRTFLFLSALTMTVGTVALPAPAEAERWRDRGSVRSEIRREARREHRRDERRNTLIGAGIGMLGGAILSDGDPWATIGGAAAGGLIGNVATERPRYRHRHRNWRY